MTISSVVILPLALVAGLIASYSKFALPRAIRGWSTATIPVVVLVIQAG